LHRARAALGSLNQATKLTREMRGLPRLFIFVLCTADHHATKSY
jgi:hypothetical protein